MRSTYGAGGAHAAGLTAHASRSRAVPSRRRRRPARRADDLGGLARDPHDMVRRLARRDSAAEPEPAAASEIAARDDDGVEAERDTGGWVPDSEGRLSLGRRMRQSGPWGVLAERWVPESMRGARVDPTRHGAVALTAVAALSAVLAAIGVWWARPQPVPVSAAPVLASAATGDPTVVAGTAPPTVDEGDSALREEPRDPEMGETGPILVSVTGAVRRPGLVTVPAGARVADAVAAAGGALDAADMVGLNLAAKLSDGDSVVVAGPTGSVLDTSSTGGSGATSGGNVLVNINTADLVELQTLPGVGPVTAQAIITYREDHGPFAAAEQLQEVSGIGPATMERIGPLVTW